MSETRSRRRPPRVYRSARSKQSSLISRQRWSARGRRRSLIARSILAKVPCAARTWQRAGDSSASITPREGQLPSFFDRASTTSKPLKHSAGGVFGIAAGGLIAALLSSPLTAAEVTFDRLKNAASEPGNWLTNHKTYDAKRFSPLDQINQSNIKNLHVAFVVQLGGAEPGGDKAHSREQSTPLVEDGFMYMTDSTLIRR